ncbi:hypothetical protein B0H13DRAFT_2432008 [Mycena leptocephala]|nr:hypothetical protein B0H13DRAFT_2432008 [Mycena leptocephala]
MLEPRSPFPLLPLLSTHAPALPQAQRTPTPPTPTTHSTPEPTKARGLDEDADGAARIAGPSPIFLPFALSLFTERRNDTSAGPRPPEILLMVLLLLTTPLPNPTPHPRLARGRRRRARDLRALRGLRAFILHPSPPAPLHDPLRRPQDPTRARCASYTQPRKSCEDHLRHAGGEHPVAGGVDSELGTARRSCSGSWLRSGSWLAEGAGAAPWATELEIDTDREIPPPVIPTRPRFPLPLKTDVNVARECSSFQTDIPTRPRHARTKFCASLSRALFFVVLAVASREV